MIWDEVTQRFVLREHEEPEFEEEELGGEEEEFEEDPGAGGGGEAPAVTGIDRSVLPEELRDLPEHELAFNLRQMVDGLARSNQRTKELEDTLRTLKDSKPAPPPSEPEDDTPLEEQILDDPKKAVVRVLQELGLTDRFERMEGSVSRTQLQLARQRHDDFDEYREDVEALLKRGGVPATEENIDGAYAMAVGKRAIEERSRQRKKAANPDKPKPVESKGKKSYPAMGELEKEIFASSGMTREEWENAKNSESVEIEVPLG